MSPKEGKWKNVETPRLTHTQENFNRKLGKYLFKATYGVGEGARYDLPLVSSSVAFAMTPTFR
jgi:hypothetical protein